MTILIGSKNEAVLQERNLYVCLLPKNGGFMPNLAHASIWALGMFRKIDGLVEPKLFLFWFFVCLGFLFAWVVCLFLKFGWGPKSLDKKAQSGDYLAYVFGGSATRYRVWRPNSMSSMLLMIPFCWAEESPCLCCHLELLKCPPPHNHVLVRKLPAGTSAQQVVGWSGWGGGREESKLHLMPPFWNPIPRPENIKKAGRETFPPHTHHIAWPEGGYSRSKFFF